MFLQVLVTNILFHSIDLYISHFENATPALKLKDFAYGRRYIRLFSVPTDSENGKMIDKTCIKLE